MKKAEKTFLLAVTTFYLLAFSCSLQAQEQSQEVTEETSAKKILPLGNITVMGSYSKVMGGDGISGLYAGCTFAPAVKLSSSDYLIPLYNGLYKRQRQIINEEEGGRLYTTIMSHNFSLMQKHLYSEMLTQRITGFVSLNYNKETADESFGDGLYDYRDYGASIDYQRHLVKTETDTATLLFGGKYFFRKYPNFQTLIALAQPTAPEEDEKDQNVWGLTSRYTHKSIDKLIFVLSYDYLFKHFTDKHTIDLNGILQDEKRKDHVHFFKMQGSYKLNKNCILGLDGEIELNNSNQNHYDSLNTPLALGDDVFVPHYFNYNKYEIKPALTFIFPLAEKKNVTVKLAYLYTVRDYPNRNIRNSQGGYIPELQDDRIHTGLFNINFPLSEKFSFLINADYSHTTSNMEYERFYRYDYDLFHILGGLSYKF